MSNDGVESFLCGVDVHNGSPYVDGGKHSSTTVRSRPYSLPEARRPPPLLNLPSCVQLFLSSCKDCSLFSTTNGTSLSSRLTLLCIPSSAATPLYSMSPL